MFESEWYFSVPVSVVGNRCVGNGGSDSRNGSDEGEYFAAHVAKREARVERVVDEYGRFQHHQEVADCQVHDEDIWRRPQRFSSVRKLTHNCTDHDELKCFNSIVKDEISIKYDINYFLNDKFLRGRRFVKKKINTFQLPGFRRSIFKTKNSKRLHDKKGFSCNV